MSADVYCTLCDVYLCSFVFICFFVSSFFPLVLLVVSYCIVLYCVILYLIVLYCIYIVSGDGRGMDPIEKRKNVSFVKEEATSLPEVSNKGEYLTMKGTVTYIKHDQDPFYTACPVDGCNKKVIQSMTGLWRCEKCASDFDQVTEKHEYYLLTPLLFSSHLILFQCIHNVDCYY